MYEVEAIKDQRKKGSGMQYLVQWKGYPKKDDFTWESTTTLKKVHVFQTYLQTIAMGKKLDKLMKQPAPAAKAPPSPEVTEVEEEEAAEEEELDGEESEACPPTANRSISPMDTATDGISPPRSFYRKGKPAEENPPGILPNHPAFAPVAPVAYVPQETDADIAKKIGFVMPRMDGIPEQALRTSPSVDCDDFLASGVFANEKVTILRAVGIFYEISAGPRPEGRGLLTGFIRQQYILLDRPKRKRL